MNSGLSAQSHLEPLAKWLQRRRMVRQIGLSYATMLQKYRDSHLANDDFNNRVEINGCIWLDVEHEEEDVSHDEEIDHNSQAEMVMPRAVTDVGANIH